MWGRPDLPECGRGRGMGPWRAACAAKSCLIFNKHRQLGAPATWPNGQMLTCAHAVVEQDGVGKGHKVVGHLHVIERGRQRDWISSAQAGQGGRPRSVAPACHMHRATQASSTRLRAPGVCPPAPP